MIQYVQMKRVKGFKLPENTHLCTRPHSLFQNPFEAGSTSYDPVTQARFIEGDLNAELLETSHIVWPRNAKECVQEYHEMLEALTDLETYLEPLKQFNYLSCWCKEGNPCHVQDILIPLVNT